MKLKDSKTYLNLAKAYAGECQARTRYEFIEYGARYNGYGALAEIIDKIVYNEFNHARMFYTAIQNADKEEIKNIEICSGYPFKEKWDLTENLRLAMQDEEAEVKLYPEFAETAKKEGFPEEAQLFLNIAEIEKTHFEKFKSLYTQMSKGTLYKKSKPVKWVCSHCGYEITDKEAPKKCPVCQVAQGEFLVKIDE